MVYFPVCRYNQKMDKRPNILIFMTDHQRGDSMFKEGGVIRPNLDRLMKNGITS